MSVGINGGSAGLRIGLYGGSFDPVHLGHLLVARSAMEEFGLDRLVFIPAARSPFKPGTAPAPGRMRARMLRLALAGETRVEVDEQELGRSGPSYSVDTARVYAGRHPQAALFWLIGADHLVSLPQWREATVLAELVEFLVIPRPGAEEARLGPPFRLRWLKGFPLALSSSEIRARARDGRELEPMVPGPVAAVIRSEGLYRE